MGRELPLELVCNEEAAGHGLAWCPIIVHGCRDVELFANDAHGGNVKDGHLQLADFFAVLVVLLYAGTAPDGDVKISLVVNIHSVGIALAFDGYDVLVKGGVALFVVDVSAHFTRGGVDEEHVVLVEPDAVGNAGSADQNLGGISIVAVQGTLLFLEALVAGSSQKEPALGIFLSVVITDLRIAN